MNNKEKYRLFCEVEVDMPIFSKNWWLDSVCGEDGWEVLILEKGGDIIASMPYQIKKKRRVFDYRNANVNSGLRTVYKVP